MMAGAVKLVYRVCQETAARGAGSDSHSDDDDDIGSTLVEYIASWKHAGSLIEEAISNGSEVCLS